MVALAVAALAIAAGFAAFQRWQNETVAREAAAELLALSLPDPGGRIQRIGQWQGKVLVINFWATWCEPCREEMPALLRVQRKYSGNGVQIVGIALDSAAKVQEFAKELKIDYPLVIGTMATVELARRLGNRVGGLPYTVVLDRSGKVVRTRLGAISESELEAAIQSLLS